MQRDTEISWNTPARLHGDVEKRRSCVTARGGRGCELQTGALFSYFALSSVSDSIRLWQCSFSVSLYGSPIETLPASARWCRQTASFLMERQKIALGFCETSFSLVYFGSFLIKRHNLELPRTPKPRHLQKSWITVLLLAYKSWYQHRSRGIESAVWLCWRVQGKGMNCRLRKVKNAAAQHSESIQRALITWRGSGQRQPMAEQ